MQTGVPHGPVRTIDAVGVGDHTGHPARTPRCLDRDRRQISTDMEDMKIRLEGQRLDDLRDALSRWICLCGHRTLLSGGDIVRMRAALIAEAGDVVHLGLDALKVDPSEPRQTLFERQP
ncbi:hypothetical protein Lesp02_04000 [Lentzea sp. NBRC 105346]|nr:hypothetical protein Lesp02_04000 [Lentzea sp. NBRC 105346]